MELRRLSQSLMEKLHASELGELEYILKDNFTENQLVELTTGTAKLLQENRNRQKFKEALQFVGRNDLAVKLEKLTETVSEEHRNGYNGYNVISHIPNEDLIPKIFTKLFEKNKDTIQILLKNGRRVFDKQDFDKYCKEEYFEKQFKAIMLQRVFTLPDTGLGKSNRNPTLQAPFDIIMKTMENWCNKYQEEGNIKGLVIFGYSLDDHSKFLKYHEDIIKNHLYKKTAADFQETVTVYNPQKRIIFLIRRAKDKKDLENEMKCSIDDTLKFVFLYSDILKNSGIKLINLVATDADIDCYRWKCKFCEHQVISMHSLDSCDLFENWLEKKKCHFKTDYDPANKNNSFSLEFSAKLLGFLASFQFLKENHFYWRLPSLTENPTTQMAETTILLTLEQLRIVNSPNKHLMIQGCYGSGKSLIALKKAEMISKHLKQNEVLYFLSYDSSSMLITEIPTIPNIKLYRNKDALKLSDIINNIQEDHPENKINLIVDEYDAEHLDENEARKLNQMFTADEKFRDSVICLVFEALRRERMVNGTKKKANLLHLLKSMELKELTYNKRNTLQIHNLVKVTTDVLKNQTTTVHVPIFTAKKLKIQSGLEKTLKKERNSETQDQDLADQQPKKEKDKGNNVRKNVSENKKLIFDEAYKYLRGPIDESIVTKEVTTIFQHKVSKYSGHNIVSEKPNLYEIYYPQESEEFIMSLIVVLEQVIGKDYENIEKHVILHFGVEKDIPIIFDMASEMMGILEKLTTRYKEFQKIDSKKIFIADFRAFRGLEYPRVVVVLDRNVSGLEQYLPECLSRCTTFLHTILLNENSEMLQETQHLKSIITAWRKPQLSKAVINSWRVNISSFNANQDSEKFYEKRHGKFIQIHRASRRYIEFEKDFRKLPIFKNKTLIKKKLKINQEEITSVVARTIGTSGSGPKTDGQLVESFLRAASDGDVTEVDRMLRDGMPVNVSGGRGWTALHLATTLNRTDVVKLMLHEGADVNRQDWDEDTPLNLAARYSYTEVARLLLDNGADVNIRNNYNKTPLDYASTGSEVERLLLQLYQGAP